MYDPASYHKQENNLSNALLQPDDCPVELRRRKLGALPAEHFQPVSLQRDQPEFFKNSKRKNKGFRIQSETAAVLCSFGITAARDFR